MRNEFDRNLPLITPEDATMTDYLIAVRVFLLLQSKKHGNVHTLVASTKPADIAHASAQFISAKAA